MDYINAEKQFGENLNLFTNPQTTPEKYNLYAGLSNLARAVGEISKRRKLAPPQRGSDMRRAQDLGNTKKVPRSQLKHGTFLVHSERRGLFLFCRRFLLELIQFLAKFAERFHNALVTEIAVGAQVFDVLFELVHSMRMKWLTKDVSTVV